jgi:hypothetical protein
MPMLSWVLGAILFSVGLLPALMERMEPGVAGDRRHYC